MKAQAGTGACFGALPDAVAGHVLATAGRQSWPTIALVCRRWRRLLYEQPALWARLRITVPPAEVAAGPFPGPQAGLQGDLEGNQQGGQQWWSGKLALTRRVAPLVAEAKLEADHIPGLEDFLAAFVGAAPRAQRLTSLSLSQYQQPLSEAPMAAVGELTCLQTLSLRSDAAVLPANAGGVLAGAAGGSLRQLELWQPHIPAPLLHHSVASLVQLTSLRLWSEAQLPPLHPLSMLRQLRQLDAVELMIGGSGHGGSGDGGGMLVPPATALFPAIESMALSSPHFKMANGATAEPPPGSHFSMLHLRRMPGIAGWLLALCGIALGAALPLHLVLRTLGVDPAHLARLCFQACQLDAEAFVQQPLLLLQPAQAPQPPLLQQPQAGAAASPTPSYSLTRTLTPTPNQLPAMQRLILRSCTTISSGGGGSGGGLDAALRPLLAALPALSIMNIVDTELPGDTLPDCLVHCLTGLTALQCSGGGLAGLPVGPYLTGLQLLALSGSSMRPLPHALATATRLKRLLLSDNADLVLTERDVDATLARMPSLQLLELPPAAVLPPLAAHLAARLPKLQVVLR